MAQHISLYRKYRPDSWDKVIGQHHVVTTLINQINMGKISHAYLFTGSRGTGKTSSAKIFAKSLNCLNPVNGSPCNQCRICQSLSEENSLDVIEMDAASNNSVDDIREIREKLQFPPALAQYRVYIIDEVHMLSSAAFNALLKTLEEPPEHIIFILATTEVHKLPKTILSRCMRFDFRLVSTQELTTHLTNIFDAENYKYEKKAVAQIAHYGEGSVRDTLSIADMCMSYAPTKLKFEDVLEILGSSDINVLHSLAKAIITQDIGQILEITSSVYSKGKGIELFNKELSEYFRELLSIKNIPKYKSYFSTADHTKSQAMVANVDNYRLVRILEILALSENLVRYSSQQSIVFDANLVKAAEMYTEKTNEGVISRISALEKKLENLKSPLSSEPNTKASPSITEQNAPIKRETTVSTKQTCSNNMENISEKQTPPTNEVKISPEKQTNSAEEVKIYAKKQAESTEETKISLEKLTDSDEETKISLEKLTDSDEETKISLEKLTDSDKEVKISPKKQTDSDEEVSIPGKQIEPDEEKNIYAKEQASVFDGPNEEMLSQEPDIPSNLSDNKNTEDSINSSQSNSVFWEAIAKGPINTEEEKDTMKNANSKEANAFTQETQEDTTTEDRKLISRLLETLLIKEGSHSFLYKTLSEIRDYSVQDNQITFFTEKDSYLTLINKDSNRKKLEIILLEIEGRPYRCIAKKPNVETNDFRSGEQLDFLKDLFGNKLNLD